MKKLLVKKDKENIISDVLKLMSEDNEDYISVTLERSSDYVYKNIDELNDLLLDDSKNINYKEEFKKIGLDVLEYHLADKHIIKVGYSERLFDIVRSYIFMVLPKDNEDEIMEFVLMPTYIYPKIYESYDDLLNLVPDLVNLLLENGYAYVGNKKSIN